MSIKELNKVEPRHRALLAIGVLLDGIDAGLFLENDMQAGEQLKEYADLISKENLEVRLPYAGTILRRAISELREG